MRCIPLAQEDPSCKAAEEDGLRRVLDWAEGRGTAKVRVHVRDPSAADSVRGALGKGGKRRPGVEVSTEQSGLQDVSDRVASSAGASVAPSSPSPAHPEVRAPEEEADAVFVFGDHLSLWGLGPLYSRAAEIFRVGPLAGIRESDLNSAADRYAGVSQRSGS